MFAGIARGRGKPEYKKSCIQVDGRDQNPIVGN